MTVTEQQRHRILAWFEEQMGPDLGATMMELFPPADASPLATKADLGVLRADLDVLRADLDAGLAGLRADLHAGLAGLRAEVKDDLLQVQRTCGTWLFTSQAAVITVLGILFALLR